MRALIECKIDVLPRDFGLVFVLGSAEELSSRKRLASSASRPRPVRSRLFHARPADSRGTSMSRRESIRLQRCAP